MTGYYSPAVQLPCAAEEPSSWADDGAESIIKQVYAGYPVVGMCEGAVRECTCAFFVLFLICVGAFVESSSLSHFFQFHSHPVLLISLGYLILLSLCVHCFGSASIWWSICCVIHSFFFFNPFIAHWAEGLCQASLIVIVVTYFLLSNLFFVATPNCVGLLRWCRQHIMCESR